MKLRRTCVMIKTAATIVSVLLCLTAASALGATLNVDQASAQCSDSGSGSASQPFCTIGTAAARAVAGTTVVVATGNYAENVTVANSGTSGAPIVFMAGPQANVALTGRSHGFTIS